MELKIDWTDFAKKELRIIFDYYKKQADVARKLVLSISKETVKLKDQPLIGQKEDLLIDH